MFLQVVVCASSLDRLLMFSALSFAGVAYAGSGLYQVIYSSITIFVAVEARILFGRQLTKKAWFGILLTTSGLVISTLGSINENEISMFVSAAATDSLPGYTQLLGIAITLCSTTVYSAIYMMSDYLVSQPVPISTQKLASISGTSSPNTMSLTLQVLLLLAFLLPTFFFTLLRIGRHSS